MRRFFLVGLGSIVFLFFIFLMTAVKWRGKGQIEEICPNHGRLSPHYHFVNDSLILARLSDCAAYRRQLRRPPPTTGFPIAYSILVHKDLTQLERLVRLLLDSSNVVCVSVDAKSRGLAEAVAALATCEPRLFLSPVQRTVFWGGFGLLQATLDCARLLSDRDFRYFINLSAQDFPLHPQAENKRQLAKMHPRNSLEILPEPNRNMYAFSYDVIVKNGQAVDQRISKRPKSPPPFNATIRKGNLAVVLEKETLVWMLNDPRVATFLDWLSDTNVPDEHFFATVLGNPEQFRVPSGVGAVFGAYVGRWVRWASSRGACDGKIVHGVCVLGFFALRRLLSAPPPFLFANKLYVGFQPEAYECLEKYLSPPVDQLWVSQ